MYTPSIGHNLSLHTQIAHHIKHGTVTRGTKRFILVLRQNQQNLRNDIFAFSSSAVCYLINHGWGWGSVVSAILDIFMKVGTSTEETT